MSVVGVRRWRLRFGVLGLLLAVPAVARAQDRFEVSLRGGWWGGYDLGTRQATITSGQAPSGRPVVMFTTDVAVAGGPAVELGFGWRLTRSLVLEATGSVARAHLEADIREDIEGAPPLTSRSTLVQVTVDGGARLDLTRLAFMSGRVQPFVAGGAGYLRQVHEHRVLVETGRTVFGGGGLIVRPGDPAARGFFGRLAFRGDVRLVVRTGGTDIEDEPRTFVSVTGGVILPF